VLCAIAYLQLHVRAVQGLTCVSLADGTKALKIDLGTKCFEGPHLSATIFICILTFLYGIGYPVWCLYKTRRQYRTDIADPKSAENYLHADLKPAFHSFRLFSFVTAIGLSIQAGILTDNIFLSVFVAGGIFLLEVLTLSILVPFTSWVNNTLFIGLGIANQAVALAYLFLLAVREEDGPLYFAEIYAGCVALSLLVVSISFCCQKSKSAEPPLKGVKGAKGELQGSVELGKGHRHHHKRDLAADAGAHHSVDVHA
jgi:hypothetical protein